MNLENFKLRKSSLLSFGMGFAGVLIMFLFQSLNFHPAELLKPLIENRPQQNIDGEILKEIENKANNFHVNRDNSIVPAAYGASDYDSASAYAAIDYSNGKIILEKNTSARLPIASLTKIMTAVVALDLLSPDYLITINKNDATVTPTRIGVVPGEKMSVRELVSAALMTSANDAAQALADGVNKKYGHDVFVMEMNAKAYFLGLGNTHFANPQGFDSAQNYSTAEDLAILSHYALTNYPVIADVVKKDYEFMPANANHKQFDLYNWNGLLDVYPGTIGMKIGNTGAAGYTNVVISTRGGKKVMTVVLGAPSVDKRDLWASEILDAAYKQTKNLAPVNVTEGQLIAKYKTWKYWN